MSGRRQDTVWKHFIKIKGDNKPLRAKCKYCEKEMCSLVARMKTHIDKCDVFNKNESEEIDVESIKENNSPIYTEKVNDNAGEDSELSNDSSESHSFQKKRSKLVHRFGPVSKDQSPSYAQ